ncbi:MAG: PQQ-dependent sugar dehydrogenase, partial [Candidatus Fonsibacter ubiquis]|nr:PQQ-dependent sugar dehydrogenase [Candidatus Fonsibacter ubiquis]
MKEFLKLLSFFLILSQSVYAQNFKIEKILDLKDPWSLTFVNKDEVLITEKDGEIVFANIKSKDVRKVKHNLNYKVDGQGGLLDILKYNNDIFICYTEDRGGGKTSTSIAKATFTKDNLNFKNI